MSNLGKRLLITPMVGMILLAAGCSDPVSVDSPVARDDVTTCEYVPSSDAAKEADMPPSDNVPTSGTATVTLTMDAGEVTMTLDRASAPCAVNSFVSLADQGYFDDTSCHRLDPGFVLQCGDPSGTGYGGPGYRFADELTGNETYPYATVAMANSGPDTNGSQFFIMIGENSPLGPDYVVLGNVDSSSMSVIDAIAAQGVDPADPKQMAPLEGGHIISVAVD